MRAAVDEILNKYISRKLMVFAIGTALALFGRVESSDWVDLSMVYIGTQGAIDFIVQLRKQSK